MIRKSTPRDVFNAALTQFVAEHDTSPHARSRRYFTTDILYEETEEKGQAQAGIFLLETFSAIARGATPGVSNVTDLIKEVESGCPALKRLGRDYAIEGMFPPVIQSAIDILTQHKNVALATLAEMLPPNLRPKQGGWNKG